MNLPIEYMLYIIPAIFAVIVVFILYEFKLKEKVHYPLAKEQDLGIGRIYLTKFWEGPMTTTDNYFAENFSKILAGATTVEDRKNALAFRDKWMKRYTLAVKDGGQKVMVAFDDNPLDRKYCRREDKGADVPIRSIGPIQDCGVEGEYDGFVWYWAKLDKTTVLANPMESEERQSELAGAKYIRLAAANSDAIRVLKEDNKIARDQLDQERRTGAETMQKLDRALSALKQHSLSEPEMNKMPGTVMPKVKQWFATPWQFVTAGVAYFVAPMIIGFLGNNVAPTSTAYVTLAITIAGFFLIPFTRKVFGRWL